MKNFDVIIIGGSYAGLSAAMALGRALRNVLVIDSKNPCNKQTPYAHNFLTQDGRPPAELRALAKEQVARYDTIQFFDGTATTAGKTETGFEIRVASGETFRANKLVFATGIRDLHPNIEGFAECWGISVLHCPYCHGYEIANEPTGVLGNGDDGFEYSMLISNWTNDLTLFTNGPSTLTFSQASQLCKHSIKIVETCLDKLEHTNGHLSNIMMKDGYLHSQTALYARIPFEQHCQLPATLGCELTGESYIKTDAMYKTTIAGIYACGDSVSCIRTIANAVAMGTITGMMLNKEMIMETLS
ncbi:MAG: FAD-dependent pyridine nucleotide-disulfide oxidoreductase [Sediminibacterium sp.]|nr:FAD-dependent pyridine nucleotide-disulfide oxidoreductase [Sediminibacterium sp.]